MKKSSKEVSSTRGALKKRHLGLAGLITVLLQYGVGKQTESSTANALSEIVQQQLIAQKAELRAENERDFVRKSDLRPVLERIDDKLDGVDGKLEAMNSKVSKIEGYLKAKNRSYGEHLFDDSSEFTNR